jgi:FkbM family methyltransferase
MANYLTNQERTAEYLKRFDREKTLKFLIKENSPIIFDVGANIGSTLEEFKKWWPESVVHCFEPQQECWGPLGEVANRYASSSVVVNRFAAGKESDAQAMFYTHDVSSGISGFNRVNLQSLDSVRLGEISASNPDALIEYARSLNHERRVQIARLDDYMNRSKVQRINLLKLDTQGYEPEVLEGLGRQLADVDVVITELMFYDYYERSLSFSDIERFLLPAGFHLYDISHIAKNPMNGRTDWVDVIYINRRVRQAQHA